MFNGLDIGDGWLALLYVLVSWGLKMKYWRVVDFKDWRRLLLYPSEVFPHRGGAPRFVPKPNACNCHLNISGLRIFRCTCFSLYFGFATVFLIPFPSHRSEGFPRKRGSHGLHRNVEPALGWPAWLRVRFQYDAWRQVALNWVDWTCVRSHVRFLTDRSVKLWTRVGRTSIVAVRQVQTSDKVQRFASTPRRLWTKPL